jgi:hypothetical protein
MEASKSGKSTQRKLSSKSSPPRRQIDNNTEESEYSINRLNISPQGRFKKSVSQKSNDSGEESNINMTQGNLPLCEKCSINGTNDSIICKAINHIKSYVDFLNQRMNMVYHKTGSINKNPQEFQMTPDYLHTIYYSDLDKCFSNKTSILSESFIQFRSLLKSIRLFNDKFEYISKKHDSFEKMCVEYKNIKIANKTEELVESDYNNIDVKNLEVHSIFKNFNVAKEGFEASLKELKASLSTNERSNNNNVKNL